MLVGLVFLEMALNYLHGLQEKKSYVFLASPSGRVKLYLQLQAEVSGAGG